MLYLFFLSRIKEAIITKSIVFFTTWLVPYLCSNSQGYGTFFLTILNSRHYIT